MPLFDALAIESVSDLGLDREFVNSLRRRAIALTRDRTLAEDIMQTSFQRLLTTMRSGRQVNNLPAYVYAIMRNVRLDAMSERREEERRFARIDDKEVECAAAAVQPVKVELLDVLRLVANLPSADRDLLTLVAIEGRSYKEVATMRGIPIGTVMSRLGRARQLLRLMVNGEAPSPRRKRTCALRNGRARELAPA